MSTLRQLIGVGALCALASGCALLSAAPPSTPAAGRAPAQASGPPATRPLDPQHVQRLPRIMVPLMRAMDHPPALNQVKVGILADPQINAASAGGAEFYVTTGLLQKANDAQLAGVLAHELAHDDSRHVAKAQTLGAGLSIGMVILEQSDGAGGGGFFATHPATGDHIEALRNPH